jgi:uncharacterized protein (UPF0332 family)
MIAGTDFLVLAETWIRNATEAEWRSAVSRAYYGAFHAARRLMHDLGFVVPRAERAHAYLWLRLSNCGEAAVVRAGAELNSLRSDRNRADYDVERTIHQADALLQVQTARRILQVLDSARIEPTRTAIAEAIKNSERDILSEVTWKP